jgi:hypothetical protein
MNGEISYVGQPIANPRNEVFQVVTFLMEDGSKPKTYVTKTMKNYNKWKDLLVEGTQVTGLKLKKQGLIDADSPVRKV